MFYCNKCRDKNYWPDGLMKSSGCCEVCGKDAICNDVPSSRLSVKPPPSTDSFAAMQSVQRWTPYINGGEVDVRRSHVGQFVSYADYGRMQDIIVKLKQELEDAKWETLGADITVEQLRIKALREDCNHE